jgi:hypothetical protein
MELLERKEPKPKISAIALGSSHYQDLCNSSFYKKRKEKKNNNNKYLM